MLRQWWKRHTDDADEGAATAEFAVVLPCVEAVAILVLCLGRASVVSMNCQDAAAAGARAFAVDDTGGESKARTAVTAYNEQEYHYGYDGCGRFGDGTVRAWGGLRHRHGAMPCGAGSDRCAAHSSYRQGDPLLLALLRSVLVSAQ